MKIEKNKISQKGRKVRDGSIVAKFRVSTRKETDDKEGEEGKETEEAEEEKEEVEVKEEEE